VVLSADISVSEGLGATIFIIDTEDGSISSETLLSACKTGRRQLSP
jgi:hypothetical protein